MIIALYKGQDRLFNRLVSWWTRGKYSHCELIFSDGVSASSSYCDKGVRFKQIDYKPSKWDFIVLPEGFAEQRARLWFMQRIGRGYDIKGLLGFVVGSVADSTVKFFCSESILAALGHSEAYRFNPNDIAPMLMCDIIQGCDFDFQKYGVPKYGIA